jgi:hypothetical protein
MVLRRVAPLAYSQHQGETLSKKNFLGGWGWNHHLVFTTLFSPATHMTPVLQTPSKKFSLLLSVSPLKHPNQKLKIQSTIQQNHTSLTQKFTFRHTTKTTHPISKTDDPRFLDVTF